MPTSRYNLSHISSHVWMRMKHIPAVDFLMEIILKFLPVFLLKSSLTSYMINLLIVHQICEKMLNMIFSLTSRMYKRILQAKEHANAIINGTDQESFQLLPHYCQQINEQNPSSTILMERT